MSLEGDPGKGWKKFKANFELFSVASGLDAKTTKIQAAALLHCIGEDVREIVETIVMTDAEKTDITAAEQADLQIKQLCEGTMKLDVHGVKQQSNETKKAGKKTKPNVNQGVRHKKRGGMQTNGQRDYREASQQRNDCHRCGYKHGYKCPAWGKTCMKYYQAVVIPCRRVPFQLLPKLEKELQRMVQDKIIVKVTEATEFVNPIVLVRKENGDLRICLDPQNLNEAILREHFVIPTFEELTRDMSGFKIFSTLDANKGFWQIELSENSSKLTTFATPFGRYKFLRMPFGPSNAPEIFQRTFTDIFGDIEGVEVYFDDVIIHAKNEQEHDDILQKVFRRARKYGVKFNLSKCKFKKKQVRYVGHIFCENGISIDEEKIEAIKRIPEPTNAKELSRFLGMVTALTKKDQLWSWLPLHRNEFEVLKQKLMEAPVLRYFDKDKQIVLSVDSSKDGMGAVILQENKPIAYASKSLTLNQQNYAQIEKELLAIVFGCQRFHQFLFGKEFIVETDHKPLEAIFEKPLDKCPLRLQRLRISLQNYSFVVKYKPGSQLYLADTLSRAHYNDENFDVIESAVEAQVDLINYVSITSKKFEIIREETSKDPELKELIKIIKEGWPKQKSEVDLLIRPYWIIRDELVIIKDVLCRGDRVVIPKILRADILNWLHYNHMGIEKTLLRAQETVYWPFIGKEITDVINSCPACLKYQNSNQKESLINRETADRPWSSVAVDLFHFDEKEYLLLVDMYSRYPEVVCLNQNTTHDRVISAVKSIFARHGKPDILYSDNGPQFVNNAFQRFLEEWEITQQTSSPRYPQSNGFIERHVQTIKRIKKKTLYDKRDMYLTLLEYRNTPISKTIPSPAQILFGRRLKGHVPVREELLNPCRDKTRIIRETNNQEVQYHSDDNNKENTNNVTEIGDSSVRVPSHGAYCDTRVSGVSKSAANHRRSADFGTPKFAPKRPMERISSD
ncbi:uncharacterized protein K02A2.6-like [Temnothorax curvispinosus]|uniref:RNA-directed DNA polymerase n=1 Tax=Temnothorax curvispinosus TaxID=300111 RepID=A0A6J1PVV2_9HYME|nr:uncharacterized protein K02A2.6-like [Temnothorax curvispinosus]